MAFSENKPEKPTPVALFFWLGFGPMMGFILSIGTYLYG
jgi:hypothetical protein